MDSSQSSATASGGQAYLSLTRKLAHSEKKERDRAVRFVAKWLAHQPNVNEADLRKLWQGLFFCLWHADKLLVQAEVANNLASLIHSGGTVEAGMRYFSAALWTIQQRWQTVDKYRVDKFLSLLRHLLRQALLLLARHQWRAEDIAHFARPMKSYPFGDLASSDSTLPLPQCPGIALHFADIFMDELTLALETCADGNGKLKLRQGLANDMLEPFLHAASRYSNKLVLTRIENRVIMPFLRGSTAKLPVASPIRFIDYPALSARLFEYATGKNTKESHRGRFYRYRTELQKRLNPAPSAAPVSNGQDVHESAMATEENGAEAGAEEEEEEHTENGAEEEEEDEVAESEEADHTPMTKKRRASSLGVQSVRRTPQRSWIQAYRKKARVSLGFGPGICAGGPGCADDSCATGSAVEEEVEEEKTSTTPGTPKKARVRFSLESNMSQEFRKIDPPAKHSRGSSPVPNRKPAFGILKSPLKTSNSPAVLKI